VNFSPDQLCSAADFCQQPLATKLLWLRQRGLERYGQLLGHMIATPENLACLERFLYDSNRIKFPPLQGTNLAGLDLRGFNLIRANLTGANLQGTNLQAADMMFGNLTQADLSNANLQGATLQEVRWQDAIVQGCDFRHTRGITTQHRQWLEEAGAIL
jgi:uncharacterized protein YjbI with pentapeptide repeats